MITIAKKTHAIKPIFVSLLRSDLFIAFVIIGIWQIILTIVGYVISIELPVRAAGVPIGVSHGLFSHTLRWDAGWYLEIIHSSFYQHTHSQGAIFAFYPLYPLLVVTIAKMSFGLFSLPTASFLINSLAAGILLVGLLKISRHFAPTQRGSVLIVLLFILSPAAMFIHVFYSEAIFIAIGTWAYLFALKRHWALMALFLAVLTAARLPSVLFIALCGLEFLRSCRWNLRMALTNPSWLWFLLTPLGFIVYSIWCYVTHGDPLAMFHAYTAPDGWSYQVFNPNIFATLYHSISGLFHMLNTHSSMTAIVVNFILPLGAIFLLSVTAFYAWIQKGKFVPLAIFNLLAIVMFTLNSNVISVHRYVLGCISLFIIATYAAAHHKKIRVLLYGTLPVWFGLQLWLLEVFVTGNFAG